ncbi:MAG: BlaI/MecI/CopY family transcriptional regulator [Gemmatimonadetes bacterium]|nr:BlaI/MecI/CopY family transcriptional regulator [Gemmatimonadota bacterium]
MPRTQLTDLQLDIVRVLWSEGEATVAEVRDRLPASRDLATTTVATVLSRLEKQNVVTRRLDGRQYVYRPTVSERDVRRSMVADLVGSLFEGDPAALVNHLVSDAELKDGDLERVRALLQMDEGGAK